MDRRDFLKLLGVATGASVASGCNLERQSEKLIPYLVPPDDGTIPGEATYRPSVCTECPAACAVTARIREGRPVRVDGTEGHPLNEGGLCLRGQASINRLYHNERLTQPMVRDVDGALRPATWDEAMARVTEAWGRGGRRVFLSGHTTGSLSALIDETCEALSIERRPEFEYYGHAAVRRANTDVFGTGDVAALQLDGCDVLVTVGADVIETFDNPVDASRQIAARRSEGHFRWFHVEPHASMTGLKADERILVRPGSEGVLLGWLLGEGASRGKISADVRERLPRALPSLADAARATGAERDRLSALADALFGARRPALVAGGVSTAGRDGVDVARLAAYVQAGTGMIGRTIDLAGAQDRSRVGDLGDVEALRRDLAAGGVAFAVFFRTDPAGTLDDGGDFAVAMERAGFSVAVTDLLTATAAQCHVVLPVAHALESWVDAEPRRGIVNAGQPAFRTPMHAGVRSEGDVLLALRDACGAPAPVADYAEYLQARWQNVYGAKAARELTERGWTRVETPARTVSLRADAPRARVPEAPHRDEGAATLVVAPSVRWFDGRSRQLPLLNEVPDPLTTVTWGAWVSMAPATARRLGVGDRDMVRVRVGESSSEYPVRLLPALPEGVVSMHKGALAMRLPRAGADPTAAVDVTLERTGERAALPFLAGSLGEAGRGAVPGHEPRHFGTGHGGGEGPHGSGEGNGRSGEGARGAATAAGAAAGHAAGGHGERHEDVSFYAPPEELYPNIRWAMAVDLDRCVGCSACVASCYVENNVPMVGPDEHLKGREMAWIRLEPYYEEDEHGRVRESAASADFVPAMCQHCDYATCEPVCPVFATMHNDEGLNVQVYNRCVGTRYCANNCPFKQRRFNWFAWNKRPDAQNLMHPLMVNPDVSLRGKGIMEKCSFCVQRIRKARDVAKDEGRAIRDGEVVPACAQACPADAIVFGNLRDENARVTQLAHSERAHRLLDELGVGPAVFYLSSKGSHDDV